MKSLIVILSVVAVALLWWRQNDLNQQLEAANARIAELTAVRAELTAAKPKKSNWVEETNRKWQNPLGGGLNGNRPALTATPSAKIPVPAQTTYSTDSKGRYWIDSSGVKHYVP